MASRIEDSIHKYVAAWNEKDEARRAELLESCWSKGGTITLTTIGTVGQAGLLASMAAFRREHPDDRAVLISRIDHHHQCFRVEATVARPDGTTYGNMTEVGETDSEGRILRVMSFADPIARP